MSRLGTQRQFVQYHQKVLSYDPIAYWPLDEKQGTVAYDWVSGRVAGVQNGAYTGVTLGQPGIGDGRTCPYFDGTNDYVNVNTATLRGVLDGAGGECSVICWIRVSGAGVWTDSAWRKIVRFYDAAQNRFEIAKSNVNNRLYSYWVGGNVVHDFSDNGVTSTDWIQLVMTRSETADEVKYYRNANLLATDTVIGVWGSAGAWDSLLIGSGAPAPTEVWHGGIAHVALFPFALGQAAIDSLYVVG